LSQGLFHRAIVNSGVKEDAKALSLAQQKGTELSQKLHCSNEADQLACMRGKPAKDIIEVMPAVAGSNYYGAVVDGWVLTDSPIEIMRRGQHHHMPIIQGNVAEEMSILGEEASNNIQTEEDFIKAVWAAAPSIPGASAVELLRLYPVKAYHSPRQAFNAIEADRQYLCTSRRILRALSASQSEFIGRFYYTHVYTDGPMVKYGASHGLEVPFIFDTLSAEQFLPTSDEKGLVRKFQDIWSRFAGTGAPPTLWKRYDPQLDNYVVFDTRMSHGDHLSAKQCDYWDTLPGP
jgi:para-nitrobenzyl esterase